MLLYHDVGILNNRAGLTKYYVYYEHVDFLCVTVAIETGYHKGNPYHNALHAADVTQAMYCYLQENKGNKMSEFIFNNDAVGENCLAITLLRNKSE